MSCYFKWEEQIGRRIKFVDGVSLDYDPIPSELFKFGKIIGFQEMKNDNLVVYIEDDDGRVQEQPFSTICFVTVSDGKRLKSQKYKDDEIRSFKQAESMETHQLDT